MTDISSRHISAAADPFKSITATAVSSNFITVAVVPSNLITETGILPLPDRS